MVSVTISGTGSEVRSELVSLLGGGQTPAIQNTGKEQAADISTKKEKKEKVAEPATATQTPLATEVKTEEKVAYANTLEGVQGVITAIAAKHSKEKAVELLAKFGAKRGKEVPADKFAEFVKEGSALLAS